MVMNYDKWPVYDNEGDGIMMILILTKKLLICIILMKMMTNISETMKM